MALFQLNGTVSKLAKTLRNCFLSNEDTSKKAKRSKTRHLSIDPLEERQMLSITPGTATELTINEFDPRTLGSDSNGNAYKISITTTGDESMSAADNGDFVMTWTQVEPLWIRDANGVQITDAYGYYVAYEDQYGNAMYESNVYARYFTDEVQRLVLPNALTTDNAKDGVMGEFQIRYGGNEVQRLSFFSATSDYATPITAEIEIGGFDVTGDGNKNWVRFKYDETLGALENANNLRERLDSMGEYFKGITVTPVNSREFDIEFNNSHWSNEDVPELQINWNSSTVNGFLASALVSTISEPVNISLFDQTYSTVKGLQNVAVSIPVYTNPEYTAAMIETAFGNFTSRDSYENFLKDKDGNFTPNSIYAGINYDAWKLLSISGTAYTGDDDYRNSLNSRTFNIAEVRVIPVYGAKDENGNLLPDGTVFDIIFINGSGKIDHPELKIVSAKDTSGREYVAYDGDNPTFVYDENTYSGDLTPITTLKEPSSTFRVNNPETYNYSKKTGVTDQSNSVVAMDADGDFIITWQSTVKDPLDIYNTADVYARMFTPQSIVDQTKLSFYSDGKAIQGVRALGDQFRVNQYTNGQQLAPSVSCDSEGNFLVTWDTSAQDLSYFAGVKARWYDRTGTPVSVEFSITGENTANPGDGYVVLSPEGDAVVFYEDNGGLHKQVYSKFATNYHSRSDYGAGTGNPSVGFDTNRRYVLSYSSSEDVMGIMYSLGDGAETVIRDAFRVNSTNIPNGHPNHTVAYWGGNQTSPSVGVDADGDFVITYNGYGPDMGGRLSAYSTNYTTGITRDAFSGLINSDKNGDLIPYLNFFNSYANTTFARCDTDTFIRAFLVFAMDPSKYGVDYPAATEQQLARLNAVLESVLRNFRGGANDIQASRYDADTPLQTTFLATDSIISSNRDGYNSRFYLEIADVRLNTGVINLALTSAFFNTPNNTVNITVNVAVTNNTININGTRDNILAAINGIAAINGAGDAAIVNVVKNRTYDYVSEWVGTPWELDYVDKEATTYMSTYGSIIFEIILINGAHDLSSMLSFQNNPGQFAIQVWNGTAYETQNVSTSSVCVPENDRYGDSGTVQNNSSTTMTPEGSFISTWVDYGDYNGILEYGDQTYLTNQLLRYRYFHESTDTAGPRATDVILPNGNGISNGDEVDYALKHLLVTFNEELLAGEGLHGVSNINNWVLMKDGVVVSDGILSIDFGVNYSKWLVTDESTAGVRDGTLDLGTNKWEAVITFRDVLEDGNYTIIAKNMLSDRAGNALNRTGQIPNGVDFQSSFTVSAINGVLSFTKIDGEGNYGSGEQHVNEGDYTAGNQFTRWEDRFKTNYYPINSPSNPDSTASDAIGNFVVVWTSTGVNGLGAGIYGQKYVIAYQNPSAPNDISYQPVTGWNQIEQGLGIFKISENDPANPTDIFSGNQASVAMDDEGNFVVTWTEYDAQGNGSVKYKAFSETTDSSENRVVVSDFTAARTIAATPGTVSNQRNSSIAMDSDGDYVIAWEAYNTSTKSTCIYSQRFSPDHTTLGSINCLQQLTFNNIQIGQTFRLLIPNISDPNAPYLTNSIAYTSCMSSLAIEIAVAIKQQIPGIEVEATPGGGTNRVLIEFTGDLYGNRALDSIQIDGFTNTANASIVVDFVRGDDGIFMVNQTTVANSTNASVGIAPEGAFVITWTSFGSNADIYARTFISNHQYRDGNAVPINPAGDQFLVNTTIANDQKWSDVAVASDGSFVITWTSYGQDGIGDGLGGIYAQRYLADGTAFDGEFLVNNYLPDEQTHSKISMATNGDFVITWESMQDAGSPITYGIYARKYVNTAALEVYGGGTTIPGYGNVTANGAIGNEFAINRTKEGDQRGVGIAMNSNGDLIFAWDGYGYTSTGAVDEQGVFYCRIPNSVDKVAPYVVNVYGAVPSNTVSGAYDILSIYQGSTISSSFSTMVVTFNEWLTNYPSNLRESVTNTANWTLSKNGVPLTGYIKSLEFGLDASSPEYKDPNGTIEACITFVESLEAGTYTLRLNQRVTDLNGNPFTQDYIITFTVGESGGTDDPGTSSGGAVVNYPNIPGDQYTRAFGSYQTADDFNYYGPSNPTAIASDSAGNFVVAWTDSSSDTGGIWVRKYAIKYRDPLGNIYNEPGLNRTEFESTVQMLRVTSDITAQHAAVAMDGSGNFVVTWAQGGGDNNDVYYQYYSQTGEKELSAEFSAPVLVNKNTLGNQQNPSVAMDVDGDFVIVWESCTNPNSAEGWDIYAQRFGVNHLPIGGHNEVQSINFLNKPTSGSFYLTVPVYDSLSGGVTFKQTDSINISTNLNTVAAAVSTELKKLNVSANVSVSGSQILIQYTGSLYGNRDVWEILVHTTSISRGGVVYVDTITDGSAGEFIVSADVVNTPTDPDDPDSPVTTTETPQIGDQRYPGIGMSENGGFVITWTGIENLLSVGSLTSAPLYDSSIYARIFASNQTYQDTVPNAPFIVSIRPVDEVDEDGNVILAPVIDYTFSDVALDALGNFVVTWTAFDHTTGLSRGIYAQRFDATGTAISDEFLVNQSTGNHQMYSKIDMNAQGNFVISWESYQDRTSNTQINPSSYGVYARQYIGSVALGLSPTQLTPVSQAIPGIGYVGINGEIGNEFRVNQTIEYDQNAASVAMSNNGDVVFAWSGYGLYIDNLAQRVENSGVFYRRYTTNSDFSAPFVTAVEAYGPRTNQEQQLQNAGILTFNPSSIDVSFSEAMYYKNALGGLDYSTRSVIAPSSWELTCNGISIRGSILAQVVYSQDPKTGKITATLDFREQLPNGEYVLTLKDTVTDASGLNRLDGDLDGQAGGNFTISFSVKGTISGQDSDLNLGDTELVNDGHIEGEQYTRDIEDEDSSSTPRSVASDAEGNFFVVWTSTEPGQEGIWGRKYRIAYQNPANLSDIVYTKKTGYVEIELAVTDPIMLVSTIDVYTGANYELKQPSVAMDADGDIIITWAQREWELDDKGNRSYDDVNSWDVYYKYLVESVQTVGDSVIYAQDVDGNLDLPYRSESILVTLDREGVQQNPRAAIDAEGDFVIVWEAYDKDGTQWNVYGQRYAPNGMPLGGNTETQTIVFEKNPTGGTFSLSIWNPSTNDYITFNNIAISRSPNATAENVRNALATVFNVDPDDPACELAVTSNGVDQIQVEYVGDQYRYEDTPQLSITNVSITNQTSGQRVIAGTLINWESGRFIVNDTLEGDQRYPDVAMNSTGDFVVTWTGWLPVEGTVNETEANIYAKQFTSSHFVRGYLENPQTTVGPKSYSADDPDNHIVDTGFGFDGVVLIDIPELGSSGSGALLQTGYHILTAAHVVCDDNGAAYGPGSFVVYFDLPSGRVAVPVAEIIVHPSYDGDTGTTTDLAIIRLAEMAPPEANRYGLYTGRDELGQEFIGAGYGLIGQAGDPNGPYPTNVKHWYQNVYEIYGNNLDATYLQDILVYDFDGGTPDTDYFGQTYGIHDLGLGAGREGFAAQGDSGSPIFINGLIAGVVSFGEVALDFGVWTADVRVSSYVDWITSILAGGGVEMIVNQTLEGDQLWSSVGIDAAGNFVVTWTSTTTMLEQPVAPDPEDPADPDDPVAPVPVAEFTYVPVVMARRFAFDGTAITDEFFVSEESDYTQWQSQITMSPKGDFTIAWEGYFINQYGEYGTEIVAQRYVGTALAYNRVAIDPTDLLLGYTYVQNTFVTNYGTLGENGSLGLNFFVNENMHGEQYGVSLATNSEGDIVYVWTGHGLDSDGNPIDSIYAPDVFFRRATLSKDLAAPYVADAISIRKKDDDTYELTQILNNSILGEAPKQFVLTFSEEMYYALTGSGIANLSNWTLTYNGKTVRSPFESIQYGRSITSGILGYQSGKIEVILTLSAELLPGVYTLTLNGSVRDTAGNQIDGNYDGIAGGAYSLNFYVEGDYTQTDDDGQGAYDPPAFPTDSITQATNPVVAAAADGSYAIVGVAPNSVDDEGNALGGDIVIQFFNKYGEWVGPQTVVNSVVNYRTSDQSNPDIAMDRFGTTVVAWTGNTDTTSSGVFFRVYAKNGGTLTDPIKANVNTTGTIKNAKVAIQEDGTFLVTWLAADLTGHGLSVYGRFYGIDGKPLSSAEFKISAAPSTYNIEGYDLACAKNGNEYLYALAWTSRSSGNLQTIQASVFSMGSNYQPVVKTSINVTTAGQAYDPSISFSGEGSGRVFISWTAPDSNYTGVYARCFTASGSSIKIDGVTTAFQMNQVSTFWQQYSDNAIAYDGSRIVTSWSSYNQEGENYDPRINANRKDFGVVTRELVWNGTSYVAQDEQLVNEYTLGNQMHSAVAMDGNGDYVITWHGPYVPGYDPSNPPEELEFGDIPNDAILTFYRNVVVNPGDYSRPVSRDPNGLSDIPAWQTDAAETTNLIARKQTQTQNLGTQYGGGYHAVPSPNFVVPSVTKISGTNKDNTFRFVAGNGATAWHVYLDGVLVTTIPVNSLGVEFDGGGGNNTVIFEGTDGKDVLYVSAGESFAKMTGFGYEVVAKNFSNLVIDAHGGDDFLELVTSKGNDTVRLDVGSLDLKGAGIAYSIKSFETVVVTSGGGSDSILMTDSKGDDKLEMSPGKTVFQGDGFSHTVKGFASVSVNSYSGKDSAVLNGSSGNDKFESSENYANLSGSGYYNRTSGFSSVVVHGNGGNDTANILASLGGSVFIGNKTDSSMTYRDGTIVSLYGVRSYNVEARGVDNRAVLAAGANAAFFGEIGKATLEGNGYTDTLYGFDRVTLNAVHGTKTVAELDLTTNVKTNLVIKADQSHLTVSTDSQASLYELIAFDKVIAEKDSKTTGTLKLEGSVDYLFANGDWE